MKIVIVRGAPRKTGITNLLADKFAEGVQASGAELCDFDLSRMEISQCKACFACAVKNSSCTIKDDMPKILSALSDCDAFACFTPLYFYSMSAQMKIFFERCFPFVNYNLLGQSEEKKSPLAGKKFAAFSVSAGRTSDSIKALSKTWELIASSLSLDFVAEVNRGESPYLGTLGNNSARVKKILSAFKLAGESFGRDAHIPEQISSDCEAFISPSQAVFDARAKDYWRLIRSGKSF